MCSHSLCLTLFYPLAEAMFHVLPRTGEHGFLVIFSPNNGINLYRLQYLCQRGKGRCWHNVYGGLRLTLFCNCKINNLGKKEITIKKEDLVGKKTIVLHRITLFSIGKYILGLLDICYQINFNTFLVLKPNVIDVVRL